MRKVLRATGLIAMLSVASNSALAAATSPPGVNLRWDRCFGDGGQMYKTFTCDTNVGLERLLMSFELSAPRPNVSAIDFVVSVTSASAALPAWWMFRTAGACRQSATSLLTVKPAGSCVSWGEGRSMVTSFAYGSIGADRARFVGTMSLAATDVPDLEPGVEYFLGMFDITHQKSAGPGACAGCDVPVCLTFDHVWLRTGPGIPPLLLNQGANWPGSRIVGWQGGYASPYVPAQYVDGVFYGADLGCVPYSVTHPKPSTWGAVKALYR